MSARAEDYSAASTRTDKTFIVCSIVSEVRKCSPKGGFVKKDSTTSRWYEVGDFNAHEKTSQMFRDVLHESYLSSNKSKKKRRDLFRTNSKRRAIMQGQGDVKSINASAARFLRGPVARHHSYGSVKRAVGKSIVKANCILYFIVWREFLVWLTSCYAPYSVLSIKAGHNINLFNMRTSSQSARTNSFRMNSNQSVQSGHDSWHNSFQSGDGIKSEPGILLQNNPRFHRSNGSLGGDFNNSFGELQAQDQFQNSFGELGMGGTSAEFHNSCVEFQSSSLADANYTSNPNAQQFHNSFAGFNNNNDFNVNADDFHNSFGELPSYNPLGRDSPMPMHARSNPNNSGRFGNDRNFMNQLQVQQQHLQQMLRQPDYERETDSVPLSISVRSGVDDAYDVREGQFQLEFEADENSASVNRARQPIGSYSDGMQQGTETNKNNDVSIVDALENAGFANPSGTDENPFEPAPLPDMEPEPIF